MVKRPWLASRFRKPCNGTMAGPFLAACNHCGRAGPFRVRGPERRAGIDKEVSFSFTFFPGQRFRASRHGLVVSGWGLWPTPAPSLRGVIGVFKIADPFNVNNVRGFGAARCAGFSLNDWLGAGLRPADLS